MRRARVDLLQHVVGLHRVGENRQWRDVWFLAQQCFELFLLAHSFFLRPDASRLAGNGFNSSRPRRNRFLPHDPKRANLAGRFYVSAATQLHRVTVQFLRLTADLKDAHFVAVFLTKELLNIFASFNVRVWNIWDVVNRRVLCNLFVHEFFHIALLLRRQRCAREVESQFVRPYITPFLHRIRGHNFMQCPVKKMRHRVVTLDRLST